MKKAIFCFALLIIALIGYTQQLVVAVADFTAVSGYTEEELANTTELFAGFLFETGKVRVLTTRNSSQWQFILKEHDFQRSGLVDPSEIRELGRALGAQAIVIGKLMKLGSNNILNMSLNDVVSGEILSSDRKTFKDLDEFIDVVLPGLASDIVKKLVMSPLVGRWKVDGSSIILTLSNDGTFEIQNCSYYDDFKRNDKIESKSQKITNLTTKYWDITIPRTSYSKFVGTIRGSYSYTDKEINLSGNIYGIRYDYFYIYSYYEYTLGELDNRSLNKKGISESNGSTNGIDKEVKASVSYNLSNSNSLRLGDCDLFQYKIEFVDNRDDRKWNYLYYNNFSRVN
jgi:TolB-like protein